MIYIDNETGFKWAKVVPGIELEEHGLFRKVQPDGSCLLITRKQALMEIMTYKAEIDIRGLLEYLGKNMIPERLELMYVRSDLRLRLEKIDAMKKFLNQLAKIAQVEGSDGEQGDDGGGNPPPTVQLNPNPAAIPESTNQIEIQDETTKLKRRLTTIKFEVKRPRPS